MPQQIKIFHQIINNNADYTEIENKLNRYLPGKEIISVNQSLSQTSEKNQFLLVITVTHK